MKSICCGNQWRSQDFVRDGPITDVVKSSAFSYFVQKSRRCRCSNSGPSQQDMALFLWGDGLFGLILATLLMEITPKVRLRRKLLSETAFCQLISIGECDSTVVNTAIILTWKRSGKRHTTQTDQLATCLEKLANKHHHQVRSR